uniref:C-type lectin domain-containing protein n=1 Tax=Cyprinus carpio TaxID=7962 RepID=A0A8C2BUQ6_CYPCA
GVKIRSSRAAGVCLVLLSLKFLLGIGLSVFIDGWTYYQSSLYFISSEMKSWNESRRYCRERAADLIIINNTEEQDFVKNISGDSKVWIGLTDIEVEGSWKWVDGSNMTLPGLWASKEPNGKEEDCALNYSPGLADFPCDYTSKWICEKNIFK